MAAITVVCAFLFFGGVSFVVADEVSHKSFTDVVQLQPFTAKKLDALNLPAQVKYVRFGAHLLGHNVTLSFDYPLYYRNLSSKTTVTGSNVGLIKLLDSESTETFVWLLNPNDFLADILITISQHSENEPVPGGCNLEFPIEISPFLRLVNNGIDTRLEYQRASKGTQRDRRQPSCDATRQLITYEIYVFFMNENDYSEAEFRRSISVMNDVDSIKRQGTAVHTYLFNPQTRVLSMTYPGRGAVFNVIAKYETAEAAYIPTASYGCDINSSVDGCGKLNSVTGKIILTVLGIFGLIVCFRGNKYFSLQTFFFGFIAIALSTFILVVKYFDFTPTERDITIVSAGLLGGLLAMFFWILFNSPVLSTLISGLVLGFLLTATILFTTIGNEDIFRSDVNYWLIIGCGILLFPVLLLPFGNLLSIFSCSLVGSYTVVVAVDRFFEGSLSYIFLNVVKRATFDDIYLASNQVPFETKDIILSVFWIVLALLGAFLQLYESAMLARRMREEYLNGYAPAIGRNRNQYSSVKPSRTYGNGRLLQGNTDLPPYLQFPAEVEPLLRSHSPRRTTQNLPRYDSI